MLETKTWLSAWAGSAGVLAYALKRLRGGLTEKGTVLMAVLAALIFALQMLNFPVGPGTSGHFTGAAVAAIVLGPWGAVVVMTSVLVVQALLFADGGIAALGANMMNMALIGPLTAWAVYAGLRRLGKRAIPLAAFAAAWIATVAAALGAAVMLWLSASAPFHIVAIAMGGWHALIGIGEGLITAGLIGYLTRVRPDLLSAGQTRAEPDGRTALRLGLVALAAAALSLFASSLPDGLEATARALGMPEGSAIAAPLTGYALPGLPDETLGVSLAGLAGVIAVGAAVYGLLSGFRRGRKA